MNENHRRLCPSPQWAEYLRADVLPAVTQGVDLGSRMLEIGPGPGAATDWLRRRVEQLVAVECDEQAAADLRTKHGDVSVVHGDGAHLDFADASFDSAGCFTMLHHVATAAKQDAILAEVLRVLRPGGVLVGSDSRPSDGLREFHEGDTYNPVDPDTFEARLRRVGFDPVTVRTRDNLEFLAYKPAVAP